MSNLNIFYWISSINSFPFNFILPRGNSSPIIIRSFWLIFISRKALWSNDFFWGYRIYSTSWISIWIILPISTRLIVFYPIIRWGSSWIIISYICIFFTPSSCGWTWTSIGTNSWLISICTISNNISWISIIIWISRINILIFWRTPSPCGGSCSCGSFNYSFFDNN